jgi:hypothetical protein
MSEQPPQVGQIRLARPDQGEDVLVLIFQAHDDHVEAALCSHEYHLVTEMDCLLPPQVTGYLRPLLVHGEVNGRILNRRLGHVIGRVNPELTRRVELRGRGLDFASTDLGRGRPILSESEPRWSGRLDKFRQLRGIQARARELGLEICALGDPAPTP